MNDLRTAAQQALEILERLHGGCTDSDDGTVEAITIWCPEIIDDLRAALAQQAEPVGQLAELQAVLRAEVDRLIAAGIQPQRKPLPNHDQHCVDVPGYGLMAVRLVRAVERAHKIGEGA